jgi:hypothetical protein
MIWLFDALRSCPEIAIFLALAAGFYVGGLKFGKFSLGNVTGVLLTRGFNRQSRNRPELDQHHSAGRRCSHFYHLG